MGRFLVSPTTATTRIAPPTPLQGSCQKLIIGFRATLGKTGKKPKTKTTEKRMVRKQIEYKKKYCFTSCCLNFDIFAINKKQSLKTKSNNDNNHNEEA